MKLTETQKMWLAAELLTFASDYNQAKRNNTTFDADAEAKRRVGWIEAAVLSGLPIDSNKLQGVQND